MSGRWEVKDSFAFELQGKAIDWNYYELLNLNSLLSLKAFKEYNTIDIMLKLNERIQSPTDLLLIFNITSESQSWFYHMYAFKLTGGYWGMNKASLIYSDRADQSKPFNTKNNTFIKELASAKCKVKYDKVYKYLIKFEDNSVALYINNEKILSTPFPEQSRDGRIAISSKNVKIAIDKIEIKQRDKIIFEDDFNIDSIFVKILKVQKIPINNIEADIKP